MKDVVRRVMTTGEIASESGMTHVQHHLSGLVQTGEIVRLTTAGGTLYAPKGTESAVCHLTAGQLRLLIRLPTEGCMRQSDLPSGFRKELKSLLDHGFVAHVGLAAWKSVALTDSGRLAAAPFRDNPKFPSSGMLSAYAPITAFLVVLYDLLHPRDAGAYDVLMILGNTDLPANNRTESAMMWLSNLGYLERHRANGRNHQYQATEKGRRLATELKPEIEIANPEDVQTSRDACDARPRRVRATGSWSDIEAAKVRIYKSTGEEVVPAIEFIADGDEPVRRTSNEYGGVETVNYRQLENKVRDLCRHSATAAEIARACEVPVNSVFSLIGRMVAEGSINPVTGTGRPGRIYTVHPVEPAWHGLNRRLLSQLAALNAGTMPNRRVIEQLEASSMLEVRSEIPYVTESGRRALAALMEGSSDVGRSG